MYEAELFALRRSFMEKIRITRQWCQQDGSNIDSLQALRIRLQGATDSISSDFEKLWELKARKGRGGVPPMGYLLACWATEGLPPPKDEIKLKAVVEDLKAKVSAHFQMQELRMKSCRAAVRLGQEGAAEVADAVRRVGFEPVLGKRLDASPLTDTASDCGAARCIAVLLAAADDPCFVTEIAALHAASLPVVVVSTPHTPPASCKAADLYLSFTDLAAETAPLSSWHPTSYIQALMKSEPPNAAADDKERPARYCAPESWEAVDEGLKQRLVVRGQRGSSTRPQALGYGVDPAGFVEWVEHGSQGHAAGLRPTMRVVRRAEKNNALRITVVLHTATRLQGKVTHWYPKTHSGKIELHHAVHTEGAPDAGLQTVHCQQGAIDSTDSLEIGQVVELSVYPYRHNNEVKLSARGVTLPSPAGASHGSGGPPRPFSGIPRSKCRHFHERGNCERGAECAFMH